MLLKVIQTHAGKRYYLYEQARHEQEIIVAYFDSLEAAGLVKRYLSGSNMRGQDQERAVELMRAFDNTVTAAPPPV